MREVQPSGNAGQSQQYHRDDAYYCENVVLLVENTLFCLPKTILCQSPVLASKLDLFLDDYGSPNDAHPLPLEGCTAQEFRSLLRILLPLRHDPDHVFPPEECLSALKLSKIWDLTSLRTSSLRALKTHANADPVLKLLVAVAFDTREWLVPAVNSLAHRIEPLGYADVDRLTSLIDTSTVMDLVLNIAQVREGFRGTRSLDTRPYFQPTTHSGSGLARHTYHTAYICDVFSCNLDGSPRFLTTPASQSVNTSGPMHLAGSGPNIGLATIAQELPTKRAQTTRQPVLLSAEHCTPPSYAASSIGRQSAHHSSQSEGGSTTMNLSEPLVSRPGR